MDIEDMSLKELEALQEKHRQQLEQNREKVKQRKARTHKLIVIGAEVAKMIPGYEKLDDEQLRDIVTTMLQ